MKVVALISGGKDSCFNMVLCRHYGHDVVALANLLPPQQEVDDMDSYMYQTVGHQVIDSYAQCMGLPLYRRRILGHSKDQRLVYEDTFGDEVEDLAALLAFVKQEMPEVTAVSSGAIASDYQRTRVERVCSKLGLVSLAYLWHQPQSPLLQRMIDAPIDAILAKVAAAGLYPNRHLGASLQAVSPHLHSLREKFGINVCGEGGEYETLTLDCPLFTQGRLVIDHWDTVMVSEDTMAPVALLHPTACHVEPKEGCQVSVAGGAQVVQVPDEFQAPSSTKASEVVEDVDKVVLEAKWDTSLKIVRGSVCTSAVITVLGGTSECQSGDDTAGALTSALQRISDALDGNEIGEFYSWNDAVFVHLYVPAMSQFATANAAYSRFLPPINPPARATVQLAPNPHAAMVVEVLFAPPELRSIGKKVLHVQSISEWAPSCIGPYSQAVSLRGLTHFAGQIPLDPPTMAVIEGDVAAQSTRSMQSCQAVAIAMGTDLVKSMLWCTVYTSAAAGEEGRKAAEHVLSSFLQGHQGPLDSSNSTSDENDGIEEEEDDAFVDTYLAAPELSRHWAPLITFIEVPELPRGVAVEIQPVAWSLDPSMTPSSSSSSSSSSDSDDEHANEKDVGDPRLPRWVQNLQSSNRSCTLSEGGRVELQTLISPGNMLRCHAFLHCDNDECSVGRIAQGVRGMASLVHEELASAGLSLSDRESAKIFLPSTWNGDSKGVAEIQDAVSELCAGENGGPSIVPVLAIGLDAAAQADIGIELLARR